MNYIPADKLIAEIDRLMNSETRGVALKSCVYKKVISLITSLQQEQPEVDYNIIPLPEERMVSYIAYCLRREDDDCNCPTCGKHVTGLRHFPYYYDRENNDVYFATVCPKCGKIIISKE